MNRIRVLIVDDHPVVRDGLRAVLSLRSGLEVVGEAGDGDAAVAAFERLRPDVSIVDLRLPGMSGTQAIAAMRRLDGQARIVAFTSFGGDVELQRALDCGASGILLKGASGREIEEAVRAVQAGRTWMPDAVQEELGRGKNVPLLTPREKEILELIAEGCRNREIARTLGLALDTVKVHVRSILEKLDSVDRTEAVTRALRRGLIGLS